MTVKNYQGARSGYLTFHIGCCPVLLPGLDRADFFVVVVHVVVEEANDGGLS